MREDCNGKYAQISLLISVYSYDFAAHMFYASVILCFDSCMREDCNGARRTISTAPRHFDSCMREDCNSKYAQISALISVHSYDFSGQLSVLAHIHVILLHICFMHP